VDGRAVVTVLRPQLTRWPRTGRALADLSSAAATGELVYELLAGSLGRSRTVGLLAVGRPLDPAATEALRFNPGPPARASCPSAASTGCAARRCQQPEGRKAGISRR
jgi:hypothetical protein